MEKQAATFLKRRLDSTVLSMAAMVKEELYVKIILPTVTDWFNNNDTIISLNNTIKKNIENHQPFLEKKLKSQLLEFEEHTKTELSKMPEISSKELNMKDVTDDISNTITIVVGTIGTVIAGTIAGGHGMALIASGPVGWVIGAVVAAVAFALGKGAVEGEIKEFISDKHIPGFVKRLAKDKVVSQLKLNEAKFEQDIYNALNEQVKPVYEVIDNAIRG